MPAVTNSNCLLALAAEGKAINFKMQGCGIINLQPQCKEKHFT
jgi:hypothetical protein